MPDPVTYNDAASAEHLFQVEDGDTPGEERPVHGLPSTVIAEFTAIKTAVQALSALISGGKLPVTDTTLGTYVDGLEALLGTLNGYVDGLETLIGATNTASATLHSDLGTLHTDLATTLAGYVDGLEALATTLNGYVDGLETLIGSTNSALSTLGGYVDGLETLIGTTNTNLATLHTDLATTLAGYVDGLEAYASALNGYVDGLEGLIGTTNTNLATIATNQGVPSGGPKAGYVGSIGTGADVSFGSQALTEGMLVKNVSAAGEALYLSQSATPTATNGYVLEMGEAIFVRCTNANALKMRSSTGSVAAACYMGA